MRRRRGLWGLVLAGALLVACGEGDEVATPARGTPTAASRAATTAPTSKATAKSTATGAPTAAPTATATATATAKALDPAAGATTVRVADTALGKVLVDERGRTLYTFENDPPNEGRSVCNGNCAALWPPLAPPTNGTPTRPAEATAAIAVITRDDGSKQVAYGGRPLYRYQADNAPGETKGQGVGNGAWTVARP